MKLSMKEKIILGIFTIVFTAVMIIILKHLLKDSYLTTIRWLVIGVAVSIIGLIVIRFFEKIILKRLKK